MKATAEKTTNPSRIVAAVDLGSNSFHLIIASLEDNGSLKIIDRIKEMVRLGAGLNSRNYLNDEIQQRALDCLSRFSQRLQNIPKKDIRVAGTNTLRIAKNSNQFIKKARKILKDWLLILAAVAQKL